MSILTKNDLLSLEEYHKQRQAFREQLREHKAIRRLAIGPHVHLFFENKKTMLYQIQEMLYAEKIIDEHEIQNEINTYNPMIPDGNNWKATMMIEYVDEQERRTALKELVKIEQHVYLKIEKFDNLYAFYDEDLDRANEEKTSAVHFLRFQMDENHLNAIKEGRNFTFGIDHPQYEYQVSVLLSEFKQQLLNDLD